MRNYMKLFFCLALIGTLISCGDDDGMSDSTQLEGTWMLESFDSEVQTVYEVLGQGITISSYIEGDNMNISLEMRNGSFSTTGSYDALISITTGGIEGVQQRETIDPVNEQGIYTTSGNELTFSNSFIETTDPLTGEVIREEVPAQYSINNGKLTITQDDENLIDQLGQQTELSIRVIATSVWTKQ